MMLTLLKPQDSSPMEGIDHLFLLPERALTMDATRLQKDLAGLDFDARLLHEAPMGNIWLSGSRPSSATKEDTKARLKCLKERENEERQRKLEELKAQALAAQRFKDKQELERRQRFHDMRNKEDSRRQQVEDRKKAINDAERDRLETIFRRNQERDARIEAKRRNERHSMGFAFGSSTPRMLEPTDSFGSFWGQRRATSTQNITCTAAPLSRRPSERELDGGSKKRATSAGGLERTVEDRRLSTSMYEIFNWRTGTVTDFPIFETIETNTSADHIGSSQVPAGCASGYVGRRRTDLMPTIPSRESPSAPPRKSFTRSPAPSRPSSSLSQQSTSSVTSSVNLRTRPVAAPRRPRPVSIAVTGISSDIKNGLIDSKKAESKPPLPKTRKSNVVKSTEKLKKKSITSPTDGSPKSVVSPTTNNIPVTHSPVENTSTRDFYKTITKESRSHVSTEQQQVTEKSETITIAETAEIKSQNIQQIVDVSIPANVESCESQVLPQPIENKIEEVKPVETVKTEEIVNSVGKITLEEKLKFEEKLKLEEFLSFEKAHSEGKMRPEEKVPEAQQEEKQDVMEKNVEKVDMPKIVEEPVEAPKIIENSVANEKPAETKLVQNENSGDLNNDSVVDMTASMTKIRINTEEEAKAALAERRRVAREEAERQAELERRRIEEEERLEFERQQREEEQQRILIEQMRAAEQERLEEAIKETKKREEEERLRKEEENRIKLLKEEAERKAREEAERQKVELQERLKNEEKEREARRKRVEAIMLRTRGKNNSSSQPQTEEKNEENKPENLNGSKVDAAENGHNNGKEIETVDNIIPVDSLKNANTVNNIDNLSTDDTLNSNNAWQHNTQTDLLM